MISKRKRKLDVRRIRLDAKLTQVELARQLGVCQAAVAHWEAGRRKISGPARILIEQIAAGK